jgi:hypothetical protein
MEQYNMTNDHGFSGQYIMGASGIQPEDIASNQLKTFGIGSGDGGPSDERTGESGQPLSVGTVDISKGCP